MSILFPNSVLLSAEAETIQPLTHARIGYDSIARTGALTASSETFGFPAIAAREPDTYSAWRPASVPATWEIQSAQPEEVDFLGIASHDLYSSGAAVALESSDDGETWVTQYEAAPGSDDPFMFLITPVTALYWRVRVTGAVATIGVIYIGLSLAMQRPIYGGITPITLGRETVIRPQTSERGQFLGRSIIRAGVSFQASWRHLLPAWYRENFDPFVLSARRRPFFIAWRPLSYPAEVGYMWTQGDITPSNMGMGAGMMQVSLSCMGISKVDAESAALITS